MARPLFRPKTDHKCHQKPNPSRETVSLKIDLFIWFLKKCCYCRSIFARNVFEYEIFYEEFEM